MSEITGKNVDRRSFLRGSALFAAALGITVVPGVAGAAAADAGTRESKEEKPADPFGEDEKPKDGKLIDKEGREYRVCPQCGYNMYKQAGCGSVRTAATATSSRLDPAPSDAIRPTPERGPGVSVCGLPASRRRVPANPVRRPSERSESQRTQ